jgi:di/tricarboxylate transporter
MVYLLIIVLLVLLLGNTGKVLGYFVLRLSLMTLAYLGIPLMIIIGCFYKG